ncbi:MAG: glycosyltransferase [Bacteroidota bacterium]|nr:glycosyltransferase [Bacteroidota bacterium]
MFYSVIVPVYNRPDEIQVLLQCLTQQNYSNFEVIVVESGSDKRRSDEVVQAYSNKLNIRYIMAGNNGPGLSRNEGFKVALGDYFIVLDSDILLENDFIFQINKAVSEQNLDAHGGPDKCHPSFTDVEKACNYSLTSFLTTGGMRGGNIRATKYFPRSFNMGFSRKVYETVGGFAFGFMGEDIELSHRIINAGFKVGLIPDAFVYHHRKKDFSTFFKYMKFFGKSRINLMILIPNSLKIIHLVPVAFVIYFFAAYLSAFISFEVFLLMKALFYTYFAMIFIDSSFKNQSLQIGFLSMIATFVQFFGYGLGFMEDFWKRIVVKQEKDLVNI